MKKPLGGWKATKGFFYGCRLFTDSPALSQQVAGTVLPTGLAGEQSHQIPEQGC